MGKRVSSLGLGVPASASPPTEPVSSEAPLGSPPLALPILTVPHALTRRRHRPIWLAISAVAASLALAGLLSSLSPLRLLELKLYDLNFLLRGTEAPPGNIILVLIDPRTQKALPEPFIFWHPHYAALFRAASQAGARAIGLDVSFAISVEPWAPDYDRQLAAAFAEVSAQTPIVLAYDTLQPPAQILPLYLLASASGSMGYANLTLDTDNFVRRQELVSRDDKAWESFAARLASVSLSAQWKVPDSRAHPLQLGDRVVPVDSLGFMRIHFWGPAGTFPSVSMADVLTAYRKADASALERWFKDKVVIVGMLDPSDMQPTPFYLAASSQQLVSGAEIQASILASLLEGRYLRDIPRPIALLILCAGAAVSGLCGYRLRLAYGALSLFLVATAYLVTTAVAQAQGWVLPMVPVYLAIALAGAASSGVRALTEGRQRRLLQEVLGRYVSAEVAQELLEYGEIPLGGTRQPVTVMFTDLRNYTRYCQGRDPQQVVSELNEYFSDMTEEIKSHGGMINKFIGDGIMALFGAPVPHPEDALRGVACALKMVQRNEEFNRRRRERGQEELVIGIGLHTGEAVVGHIGAPDKMEYTAIGDTVNVASRIEGENKTFGSRLLISEATYRYVQDRVIAELAGHAHLKGVREPVPLYRVTALR